MRLIHLTCRVAREPRDLSLVRAKLNRGYRDPRVYNGNRQSFPRGEILPERTHRA
jgi:hypothetical protein